MWLQLQCSRIILRRINGFRRLAQCIKIRSRAKNLKKTHWRNCLAFIQTKFVVRKESQKRNSSQRDKPYGIVCQTNIKSSIIAFTHANKRKRKTDLIDPPLKIGCIFFEEKFSKNFRKIEIKLIVLMDSCSSYIYHSILHLFFKQYKAINPTGSYGLKVSTYLRAPFRIGKIVRFRYSALVSEGPSSFFFWDSSWSSSGCSSCFSCCPSSPFSILSISWALSASFFSTFLIK